MWDRTSNFIVDCLFLARQVVAVGTASSGMCETGEMISQGDSHHGVANMRGKIFIRYRPCRLVIQHRVDTAIYRFWIWPAQHVAARLYRFGTLGHIPDGHVWYFQDTALFLHRAAVAEQAEGVLLQRYKIKETEGAVELDLPVPGAEAGRLHPSARVWMQAAHYGHGVFLPNQLERSSQRSQALLHIHVLCPVHCDEEVTARLQPQPVQDIRVLNGWLKILEYLEDRVANHVDSISFDAFAQQVGPAAFGVRH